MLALVLASALAGAQPVPWAPELSVGDDAPDVALIDERGTPFRFSQLRGDAVVLSFVSTRCGDICPLITARFAQLAARERTNDRVRLLEVSVDPEYDRPAVLRAYGAHFGVDGKRWRLATGERDAVLSFAARFGAAPSAIAGRGIDHEGRTVLLDGAGQVRTVLDGARWRADDVAASLASGFGPLPWWSQMWNRLCGSTQNPYERVVLLLAALAALGVTLGAPFGERSRRDRLAARR